MITLLLIILLKKSSKEFAFVITIGSAVILFSLILDDFIDIVSRIKSITSGIENLNSYVSLMVRILGITLITQFVIDLCRDSGENALASQAEIASKIIVIIMVMPLFETVMNIVSGLLK